MFLKKIPFDILLFLFLTFLIFRSFFSLSVLSGGDFRFEYQENARALFSPPYVWDGFFSAGSLGNYRAPYLFPYLPLFLTGLLTKINMNFILVERIVWFFPILIITLLSPFLLAKKLFSQSKGIQRAAPFIYVLNTYFLMVVGGGQVGAAMAYGLLPLLLLLTINLSKNPNLKKSILLGLVLSWSIFSDPRFTVVGLIVVVLYFLFLLPKSICFLSYVFLSVIIATGIHFYWLLPTILAQRSVLPGGYESPLWVSFLSFAPFSQTFSLLHPNWPENLFGKTYLTRPEFLILPMLAFSSLFFIYNKKQFEKKLIFFLIFLALLGAFLAKGANFPFGMLYLWIFNRLPGMSLFRDPIKFYPLVALSYSFLIPFTIERIVTLVNKKVKIKQFNLLTGIISFIILLSLLKPAWSGELSGIFVEKQIPKEYLVLKDFFGKENGFFRILWAPRLPYFGYYSVNHPAISSESLISSSLCVEPLCSLRQVTSDKWGNNCTPTNRCYVKELSYLLNPKAPEVLSDMAVRYIVVPLDIDGDLFVSERKYDPEQRHEVEAFLDSITWLKKVSVISGIAVYEVPGKVDHFFLKSGQGEISWRQINPTRYLINLKDYSAGTEIIFSETYDTGWKAIIGNEIYNSKIFHNLNLFTLPAKGKAQEIIIEYSLQKYAYFGLGFSLITLTMTIVCLALMGRKEKQ